MGASACKPGGAPVRPGGPRMISVVRSSAWGMGLEEDVWPVEIAGNATIAELKKKIEELYEVPVQTQKLACTGDASAPALEDDVKVETLERQRVHLLPVFPAMGGFGMPSAMDQVAFADMAQAFLGPLQESIETTAALEESLKDVTYKVHFQRPQEASGKAKGKKVTLSVDALALVCNVQEMVEVEFFGATGAEPTFLTLDGKLLPAYAPLHYAGVEDGKTVIVAKERPPLNEQEQLLSGLFGGIAGGGAGNSGVPPEQFQAFQQQLQGMMGGFLGANSNPQELQQQMADFFGPSGGGIPPLGTSGSMTPEQRQQFQRQLQDVMANIFGAGAGGMVPPASNAARAPSVPPATQTVPPVGRNQRR